jgi:hypothetical protein
LTFALVMLLAPGSVLAQSCPWWEPPDGTVFHYRLNVEVVNGPAAREDYPIWVDVDFTDALLRNGVVGALDTASIRVVECFEGAEPMLQPSLFEVSAEFRKVADAKGTVAWLAGGGLAPEQQRMWQIYFDLEENGLKPRGPVLDGSLLVQNANNLAENASFEADADGDGVPDGWEGFVNGAAGTARACSIAHWGARSLMVTASSNEALRGVLDLAGAIPGDMYKVGAYVRVHGTMPEGTGIVEVAFPGAGRAVRFSTEAVLPTPGLWARSDVVVPSPTGTDTLAVVCSLEASTDTVLVDDVVVLHAPPTIQVAETVETLSP